MTTKYKYYVVYWTRMEGFLFQNVPTLAAAQACQGHRGYVRNLKLEVPDVPE